ncbi:MULTISPECIES: HD domain-containing protein [Kocuria]|uniref:HD domain-containing protein n=1 Tax=Kocuria TaxID=57493 RepID=UPI001EE98D17|nr:MULTISPECIES: HD domain-containing protein [Kocuria]MCT1366951.1 HD domain-containing protein [Rothia sp. p3-SID1597]
MMSQRHVDESIWARIEDLSLVSRAEALATAAHEGQKDQAGNRYIDHPRRVAGYVARRCEERGVFGYEANVAVAAAWLHDVVEDTSVTEAQLREFFPEHVVDAVVAVTKLPGETTEEYFAKVRSVPAAVVVKESDVEDNTDPQRTALLGKETRERLAVKYGRAKELLKAS